MDNRFLCQDIEVTDAEIKAYVRARDGHKCVDCGMTREQHMAVYGSNLQVHRIIPGSKYSIDGCETVCIPCHNKKPKKTIPTIASRAMQFEKETAVILRKMARLSSQSVPEFTKTWLLPVLREEFARRLKIESQELRGK